MKTETYIQIEQICTHYGVETSFIHQLKEFEIVHIEESENTEVIKDSELPKLEKMVRLHQELEINPQGLQAIDHLLKKVVDLQDEVMTLKRKLDLFEM
ncbi:chaperone modulator CbpM [Maribacter thermophilus]|uniref:chaperone modulator CbpM n=1 Tax=Maribacter thermophilus TaxID=1197874 RepID=UPI0006417CFD|nr:chaperone modulator CbpM [Maribacter thermophilus]